VGQPDTHGSQAERPLTLRTLTDSLTLLSQPDWIRRELCTHDPALWRRLTRNDAAVCAAQDAGDPAP
jgi:hypothetical protein